MNLLIAYATTDGMTEIVAERLAAKALTLSHRVTLINLRSRGITVTPLEFDGILLGASVHAGGYQRAMKRFVATHLQALNDKPSAFFSVCLAQASKSERERTEGTRIAEQFATGLGWRPLLVQPIAGALRFSRYGLLRRLVMRRIARKELPGIDVSRDHVFTDWKEVERFLNDFLLRAMINMPVEVAPPPKPIRQVPASCRLVP
jgi:menaquinone-dependent protoporphyrinogen oxidase